MTRTILAIFLLALTSAVQLPAQDADSSGRGVARLSLLSGDVSVRRGDTGEWVAAAINAPLLGEDQVLTGANSRAEVQFDYANFARLSGDTELRLADIENRRYLVRLARGTMNFRVLRSSEANAEISTPSIAIRPLKQGIYRVSVLEDGTTEVTVRSGEAEIYTPRGSQKLKSGRSLMARGSFSDPEFQTVNAPIQDDWDRWNDSRDRQLNNSRSYDYVSRDIYGAEDLDGHGRWENTPEYGAVWIPSTSVGWAPYRNGRWSWVDYYGWNWISYDPWGWAPYHYGRWINRPNFGWCWWPGSIRARHYWSPGLVAFFGWGRGGVSVGVGIGGGYGGYGNWGWVPLAPFETYYPWYGRRYYGGYRNGNFNNVTIINNTNITNVYRNARVAGGITAVNAGDFGRGSVNSVRVNRNDIERASVMRGQLPLVPDAASTRLSDREARVAPDRGSGRGGDRFFSTRQATNIDRVPFENQRTGLQEASRRTFGETAGRGTGDTGRRAGTSAPTASEDRGTDASGRGGWRRLGDLSGAATTDSNRGTDATGRGAGRQAGDSALRSTEDRGSDASGRGGWRRLGDSSGAATTDTNRGTDATGRGVGRQARDSALRSTEDRGSDASGRGGWRRLGDLSGAATTDTNRGTDATGRGAGRQAGDSALRSTEDRGTDTSGRGGWRRLGDSSVAASPDRGASGTDNAQRGSWRRFGDSSAVPSTGRGGGDTRQGTRTDSGSWGRFGDSTASTPADNGASRRGTDNGSWRRMSETPRAIDRGSAPDTTFGRGGGGADRTLSAPQRQSVDRGTFDRGTFDRGTFGRGGRGSADSGISPRMSAPPVVRERSAPSFGGGGGRQSAPAMSSPRMERSAPMGNSGGGGGGRGGDSGGGGGRSEGRGGGGRGR